MTDLIVLKSSIPSAGKGLFALRNFSQGERIIEYTGELIDERELNRRYHCNRGGLATYVLQIDDDTYIDAVDAANSSIARYANHCKPTDVKRGFAFGNNCVFKRNLRHTRGWLCAARDIAAGEEIFADYGDDYWR